MKTLGWLLVGVFGGAGAAWADVPPPPEEGGGDPVTLACATDADCGQGMVCQVVAATGCACPAGVPCECPPPVEEKACVPGPCVSDADCGEGLVCVTYEIGCASEPVDAGPPCADTDPAGACGAGTDMAPPPACEPEKKSICAPKWAAPCQATADCGEGFTCEAYESCTCAGGGEKPVPVDPSQPSGGSGSGGGDAGAPFMPPEPPECTCTPTNEKYCKPVEATCVTDANCLAGWTCEFAETAMPDCGGASGEGGAGAPDCGGANPMPPAPEGRCFPPHWADFGGREDGSFESPNDVTPRGEPNPNTETGTPPTAEPEASKKADGGCMGGGVEAGWALLGVLALVRRRRS